MANKVADLTFDQFVTEVQKYDPDLFAQCTEKEIDIREVLTAHKPTCEALSIRAGVSTARGRLQRELANLTADYKTGVIVGSADRYNAKSPIKIAMLCPDGTGVELSTFDARAKMGGAKADIVYPSIAKVMVRLDPRWKSWNVQEFMSMEPISRSDLLEVLDTVAITPGKIGIQHEKSLVVVKGIVSGVVPAPILAYDSAEERYFKDGEFEVLEAPTGPKGESPTIPCMSIRLASERDSFDAINYVTATIGKQRFGTPTVAINDLRPACEIAMQTMADDPREQSIMVADSLKGLVVYVVGYMGTIGQDRNENQEAVNYIQINVSCIVETGQFVGSDGQVMQASDFGVTQPCQTTLPSAPAPVAAPAPTPAPAPAPADPVKLPPLEKPATVAETIATKNPDTISLTRVKNQIIGLCKVSNVTPDKLNLDELHPLIMEGRVPKPMLQVVLEDLIAESCAAPKA